MAEDAVMCELFSGTNREKFREYHFLDELFQPQTYQPYVNYGKSGKSNPQAEQGTNREIFYRMLGIHHKKVLWRLTMRGVTTIPDGYRPVKYRRVGGLTPKSVAPQFMFFGLFVAQSLLALPLVFFTPCGDSPA
jgi:hypothetical protein